MLIKNKKNINFFTISKIIHGTVIIKSPKYQNNPLKKKETCFKKIPSAFGHISIIRGFKEVSWRRV